MKKYSIIMYNFNNYEIIREIKEKSPNCQYIYITDNLNLKSDTWTIVYQNQKLKSFTNVWDKCYYVRFHPFEFCNTQYCIILDGSVEIKRNLDSLIIPFMNNYDVGLLVHPSRTNVYDELNEWIKIQRWPQKKVNMQKQLINMFNNYQDNVLYALGMRICKNSYLNTALDQMTYSFLKYIGYLNNQSIDRVDQTIYSLIINHFFKNANIYKLQFNILRSQYLQIYFHHSYKFA